MMDESSRPKTSLATDVSDLYLADHLIDALDLRTSGHRSQDVRCNPSPPILGRDNDGDRGEAIGESLDVDKANSGVRAQVEKREAIGTTREPEQPARPFSIAEPSLSLGIIEPRLNGEEVVRSKWPGGQSPHPWSVSPPAAALP
jgi:hypothetical protein